jgi:hypothetical protein
MICGRPSALRSRRGINGVVLGLSVLATACLKPPVEPSAGDAAAASGDGYQGRSVAYRWRSVAIGGGGFVTGLAFSPVEAGILYARTDVGGAYRYDPKQRSWIPLTDFLGPKESNFMGIESLAVDTRRCRSRVHGGRHVHRELGGERRVHALGGPREHLGDLPGELQDGGQRA